MSHGFLVFFCIYDAAATRVQYLALSRAWWSCRILHHNITFCVHDNSPTAALSWMKFCTNMYLDHLYNPIEFQVQRSVSFLLVYQILPNCFHCKKIGNFGPLTKNNLTFDL